MIISRCLVAVREQEERLADLERTQSRDLAADYRAALFAECGFY